MFSVIFSKPLVLACSLLKRFAHPVMIVDYFIKSLQAIIQVASFAQRKESPALSRVPVARTPPDLRRLCVPAGAEVSSSDRCLPKSTAIPRYHQTDAERYCQRVLPHWW
jgi:hypothetical protein